MSQLFDDLSRIVGSGITRRRMLKLIGIAFAGGTLPALWPTRAGAFVACAQTFDGGADTSISVESCHVTVFPDDKDKCCDAALQKLSKLMCPTTCPKIGGIVTCNATCSQTNPDKLDCAASSSPSR